MIWFSLLVLKLVLSVQPVSTTQTTPLKNPVMEADTTISGEVWKRLDSLMQRGLYQTADQEVDRLLARPGLKQATAAYVRAHALKAVLLARLDPAQDSYADVRYLEQVLEQSSGASRYLLYSILASVYDQYYRQDQWRIGQRTRVERADAGTPDQWTSQEFLDRIAGYFQASLELPQREDLPLSEVRILLDGEGAYAGEIVSSLRDLLWVRALNYFSSGESLLAEDPRTYRIADSVAIGPLAGFLAIGIKDEPASLARRDQYLMLFHRALSEAKGHPQKTVYYNLWRYQFARAQVHLSDVYPVLTSSLEKDIQAGGSHPSVAELIHELAGLMAEQGDSYVVSDTSTHALRYRYKEAVALAKSAIKTYPGSFGALKCAELVRRLEGGALQLQTPALPSSKEAFPVLLSFKNQSSARLVLHKVTYQEWIALQGLQDSDKSARLTSGKPVFTRVQALPVHDDLRMHRAEWICDPLELGCYILRLSATDGSGPEGFAFFQVTDLAYAQQRGDKGSVLYALDKRKGGPVSSAEVQVRTWRDYRDEQRWDKSADISSRRTDKEGSADLPATPDYRTAVRIIHKKDTLYLPWLYNRPFQERTEQREQVIFFTDRAIYRPGQTVYWKVVALRTTTGGQPVIQPSRNLDIRLKDANYQDIGQVQVRTNEFGSTSGSFVLPVGGLTGRFTLQAGNMGSAGIQVEEYKRPSFEVSFDTIREAFSAGQQVVVTGRARKFAGTAVDGAEVSYRVTRQVRYPFIPWYYRMPYFSSEEIELTRGTVRTDSAGVFTVTFEAVGGSPARFGSDPVYHFGISADVTDHAGETRSGMKSLPVSKRRYQIHLDTPEKAIADQWKQIAVKATNLEGTAVDKEVTVRIRPLVAPQRPLRDRVWEVPDEYLYKESEFRKKLPVYPYREEQLPVNWQRGKEIFTATGRSAVDIPATQWSTGLYEIIATLRDDDGREIRETRIVELFNPVKNKQGFVKPVWSMLSASKAEPGETIRMYYGSAIRKSCALVIVERDGKIVDKGWKPLKNTYRSVDLPVREQDRGDFFVHILYAGEGALIQQTERISVPFTNKDLQLEWVSFRDKLLPGQEETWELKISGHKKDAVAAELLAAMYDRSLDAFVRQYWPGIGFASRMPVRGFLSGQYPQSQTTGAYVEFYMPGDGVPVRVIPDLRLYLDQFGWHVYARRGGGLLEDAQSVRLPMRLEASNAAPPVAESAKVASDEAAVEPTGEQTPEAEQLPPALRTNLRETVFFFPDLRTDEQGNVRIRFKMNEALTGWRLLLFAHTKELATGFREEIVQTSKDLMVFPNMPRFVRQGDRINVAASVQSMTDKELSATAWIELFDPVSGASLDSFISSAARINLAIPAGASKGGSWELKIPADYLGALGYRVYARAGAHTDGEEGVLPVLTNRILLTESQVLWVNGGEERAFRQSPLARVQSSATALVQRVSLEMTENPAWYAILALPYLSEYPYECTEQIFSRYYANSLSSTVLRKYPRTKAVFDQWRSTDALVSNLEKNPDLKSVLLSETPWVRAAASEAEQRKRIALLFDLNQLGHERQTAIDKLAERQLPDGGFPWFKGGRADRYITQTILESWGHLDRLGVEDVRSDERIRRMILQALAYTDERAVTQYKELEKQVTAGKAKWEDDHLDAVTLHYLLMRSYYPDYPVSEQLRKIMDYYLGQAEKYWHKRGIMEQATAAVVLHRSLRKAPAQGIIRSLRERSVRTEELGVYWKLPRGWFWYEDPVETQTVLIEAFSEVQSESRELIAEMKKWLLKNKQTNHWKTTKATAKAVYTFLHHGEDWLSDTAPVEVRTKDGQRVTADKQEAGTGYYRKDYAGGSPMPDFSEIRLKNPNKGPAWGALYVQYFEDLDKVKAFESTPLKLQQVWYIKRDTDKGPVLQPLAAGVKPKVGDRLVARVELQADRSMEYLHLRVMHAAGLEQMETVSGYRWSSGLGYYQSIRDTGTDIFIDRVQPGKYVWEYELRVFHAGDFSAGVSTIQCMYAPEFTSHAAGTRLGFIR